MLTSIAPPAAIPLFKTLSRDECESVLLRNNVGRIAFALHDRVNIVPIHYAFLNGWIYGRTTSAAKLRQILRNRRIAFEVDEQSALFAWRSVVVHGPLYVVQPDTAPRTRSVYRTAVSVIRRLIPEALTEADPVPFRDQLIRIRAVDVTGRASKPLGGERLFPSAADPILETGEPEEDAKLREQAQSAIATLEVSEYAGVHVEAFDGVVVLSGTVETSRDRQQIEAEVLRVPGVVAVVQELETSLPKNQEQLPSELARSAIKELGAGPSVITPELKVVVEHGWLRLEGVIQSQGHRDDSIRRLRAVKGARGVIDRTHLVSKAM